MTTDKEMARDGVHQTIQRMMSGSRSPHESGLIIRAVRAYALLVHVEACEETSGDGYHGPWSYCGGDYQAGRRGGRIPLSDIWYCSVAQQYLPQK